MFKEERWKKIFGAAVLLSSENCKSVLIWTKISVIDLEAVWLELGYQF